MHNSEPDPHLEADVAEDKRSRGEATFVVCIASGMSFLFASLALEQLVRGLQWNLGVNLIFVGLGGLALVLIGFLLFLPAQIRFKRWFAKASVDGSLASGGARPFEHGRCFLTFRVHKFDDQVTEWRLLGGLSGALLVSAVAIAFATLELATFVLHLVFAGQPVSAAGGSSAWKQIALFWAQPIVAAVVLWITLKPRWISCRVSAAPAVIQVTMLKLGFIPSEDRIEGSAVCGLALSAKGDMLAELGEGNRMKLLSVGVAPDMDNVKAEDRPQLLAQHWQLLGWRANRIANEIRRSWRRSAEDLKLEQSFAA